MGVYWSLWDWDELITWIDWRMSIANYRVWLICLPFRNVKRSYVNRFLIFSLSIYFACLRIIIWRLKKVHISEKSLFWIWFDFWFSGNENIVIPRYKDFWTVLRWLCLFNFFFFQKNRSIQFLVYFFMLIWMNQVIAILLALYVCL